MEQKMAQLGQQLEQNETTVKVITAREAESAKEHQIEKKIMLNKLADLTNELEAIKLDKQTQSFSDQLKESVQKLQVQLFEAEQAYQQLQNQDKNQINELIEQNQDLIERLRSAKDNLRSRSADNGLEEDLKRQVQLLIVKEVEIDSLKKQVKKYKDQASQGDTNSYTKQMLRKVDGLTNDVQIKEMMIVQLQEKLNRMELESAEL